MSCQVRKWRAAGAAAAAAATSATSNTPAKKEMDSRLSALLAARAAQDEWIGGCAATSAGVPTCTSAGHLRPSADLSSLGTNQRVPSSQQTAVRSSEYGKVDLLR